jgi:hypothetical protein
MASVVLQLAWLAVCTSTARMCVLHTSAASILFALCAEPEDKSDKTRPVV